MMGVGHATSGAWSWLVCTSASPYALGAVTAPWQVMLGGAVLCAGATLLLDFDHPDSTAAYALPDVTIGPFPLIPIGPITLIPSPTALLARAIHAVFGHRRSVHGPLGWAAFTVIAYIASLIVVPLDDRLVSVGSGAVAVVLVALASKSLGLHRLAADTVDGVKMMRPVRRALRNRWAGPWVLAVGTAGAITWAMDYRWRWLPVAVLAGCVIHVAGDRLTTGGTRSMLYPLVDKPPAKLLNTPILGWVVSRFWKPNGYISFPILGRTGSAREWALTLFMSLYSAFLVYDTVVFVQSGHHVPLPFVDDILRRL